MDIFRKIRWHNFKSIRTTFIVPFAVPLVIVITVLLILLIGGANKVSEISLEMIRDQVFKHVDEVLEMHLSEANQLNTLNVRQFERNLLNLSDEKLREQYFSGVIEAFPDVTMTYVGFPDRSFYGARRTANQNIEVVKRVAESNGASEYYSIHSDGTANALVEKFDNFDPTIRPWYKKAAELGYPVFSDVYNHFVFKVPTITASYPVYEDGDLLAVFGVDYTLIWLGQMLSDLPIETNGMVFITDSSDRMIASSKLSDDIFKMVEGASVQINAAESDNALIREAVKRAYSSTDVKALEFQSRSYNHGVAAFKHYGLDWKIHVLLSSDDILSDLNDALSQTYYVVFISLIIFALFAWLLTRWLTQPILHLNEAAKHLAEGKFDFVSDEVRSDELGQLSRSFNEMAINLTNVVFSLESQVTERTKDLQNSNEILSRLSFSDGLTGLPNRRKFDDFYLKAYKLNQMRNRGMAIIMMDLDNFKHFNDTYGHLTGDDCLRRVSEVFGASIANTKDLIARYGGEEFTGVLQGYSKEEVYEQCESIRKEIEKIRMLSESFGPLTVTISIGATFFIPDEDTDPQIYVLKADQALYEAKSRGKNQTFIYDEV